MSDISRSSKYGFLAVSEIANLGFCGGLLILTVGGRPVEFHCTAPVSANRAQQILYGATLKDFLLCDQIGISLFQQAKAKPDLLLVDNRELIGMQHQMTSPLVVVSEVDISNADSEYSLTGVEREMDGQRLDGHRLEFYGDPSNNGHDRVEGLLNLFRETLPLTEPFERIRQAINEAHSEAA